MSNDKKLERLMSKSHFRKWLQSKAPKTKVGIDDESPLERYIIQEGVYSAVVVRYLGDSKVKFSVMNADREWDDCVSENEWVPVFLNLVDAFPNKTMSAKKALTLLELI